MDEENDKYAMSHEEALASMRKATVVTRTIAVILFGIGLAIAYLVWPSEIMDLPLVDMTMRTLLRVMASGVIAFISLYIAVMVGI